jgi:hypothetical protein
MDSMVDEQTLMTFDGLLFASRNTFLHFYGGDEEENLAERRPRRQSSPGSLGCLECFESSSLECDMVCKATSSPSVVQSTADATLDEKFQATEIMSEFMAVDRRSIDDGHRASGFVFEPESEPLSAVAYKCFSVRSDLEVPLEVPSSSDSDFGACFETASSVREHHHGRPSESSLLFESLDESFGESSPKAMDDPQLWKQKGTSSGAHQESFEFDQHSEEDGTDFTCQTVMVKNIPCGCSKKEVLVAIAEAGFRCEFFYLPARRDKYLGYAFVGFPDPHTTQEFAKAMTGYRFTTRNSPKTLEVVPALSY